MPPGPRDVTSARRMSERPEKGWPERVGQFRGDINS
jgi:hypothetical protein